jgi:hypothetical protein
MVATITVTAWYTTSGGTTQGGGTDKLSLDCRYCFEAVAIEASASHDPLSHISRRRDADDHVGIAGATARLV